MTVALDTTLRLVTIAELAELARVSRRTIERRIADGTIPAADVVRLSARSVRVTPAGARRFLLNQPTDSVDTVLAENIHPIHGG